MKRTPMFAVLSIAALLSGCERSSSTPVATVTSQVEAMRVAVELRDFGAVIREVKAQRSVSYVIDVDAAKLTDARKKLVDAGLPREHREGLAVFSQSTGIIPSELAERARLMKAVAEELEQTLEHIDGVASARVHVVLPPKNPLGKDTDAQKPSAAVFIQTQLDHPIAPVVTLDQTLTPQSQKDSESQGVDAWTRDLVAGVRKLVKQAVPEISESMISVAVQGPTTLEASTKVLNEEVASLETQITSLKAERDALTKRLEEMPAPTPWKRIAAVGGGGLVALIALYAMLRRRSS